jgi:hypothetical protein
MTIIEIFHMQDNQTTYAYIFRSGKERWGRDVTPSSVARLSNIVFGAQTASKYNVTLRPYITGLIGWTAYISPKT